MKIKKTDLLKLNESLKKWIRLTEGAISTNYNKINKHELKHGEDNWITYPNQEVEEILKGVTEISEYTIPNKLKKL